MENVKVKTELEALNFCKENGCEVQFNKECNGTPAHVIITLGLVAKTCGKDLTEAVNRIIDMYFTPPINHEKLPWWKEQKKFYIY